MLVVTRKADESVIMFSRSGAFKPVQVKLLNNGGVNRASLGFAADHDVVFLREEVYRRKFGNPEIVSAKGAKPTS